jgi:hypothetical protein
MAAPTFIQEAETTWTAQSGTTKTTASFSVNSGDILVAFGFGEERDTNNQTLSISDSSGWTWTTQQSVLITDYCPTYIWTATAASTTSITATVTKSVGFSYAFGLNVLTFRSSGGAGASSSTNNASGAPSLGLTTTGANSAIVVANSDWTAGTGSRTWRTVNSITPTSGNGLEVTYDTAGGNYTGYGAYYSDAGATGAKTVGLSAPTGQKYAIVAVEVLASSGTSIAVLAGATYRRRRLS